MESGPLDRKPELPAQVAQLLADIDQMLEQMVEHQRGKVLETARKRIPHLTPEDVLNPEAYPAIYSDGPFNYEDGIVNGLLSAQMAIRARVRGPKTGG